MLGLFFFTQGASQSLITVLSKANFSISYSTILWRLSALTQVAKDKVESVVKGENKSFFIVYDNINISLWHQDQRLNNHDSFESGATATLIVSSLTPEVEAIRNTDTLLDANKLLLTAEQEAHLKEVSRYHLMNVLQRHLNCFKNNTSSDTAPLVPEPMKEKLPIEKTEAYPLPSMHIDQATVEGNLDIVQTIFERFLKLLSTWFDKGKRIFIAGDQLTISRLWSLAKLQWDDLNAYFRQEWCIPIIQLFHLQMVLASTILCTHFGEKTIGGSLAFFILLLRRTRIGLDKPDFHATDEFLRHTFDALVLTAWKMEVGMDDLDAFANRQGEKLGDTLHQRVDNIVNRLFVTKNLPSLQNRLLQNAALLLHDMVLYLELGSAIKAGDVGHITEIIQWLTIWFQGGKNKNYAMELLRLHCGFEYSWTPNTKATVKASWLVNMTGKPN